MSMTITENETVLITTCQGCLSPIEEGSVVAFGDSFFHVKCFVCTKCGEFVDNKSDLLLQDSGKPICDNCSYNCATCQKVIRDEAILTDDKAYHSGCFKCTSCHNKIENLIFTQTSKGIYCITCYDSIKSSDNSFLLDTSFFDSNNNELDNLSSTLGLNLDINEKNTTQYRFNRVSELLTTSLRSSIVAWPTANDEELIESRNKIKELESNYILLQQANKQALDELNQIKQDYEADLLKQKQQQNLILLLLSGQLTTRKELERIASLKANLEKSCQHSIHYRDKISTLIDKKVSQELNNSVLTSWQKNLNIQIKSLIAERDSLKKETVDLYKLKHELMNDVIISRERKASNASSLKPPAQLQPMRSLSSNSLLNIKFGSSNASLNILQPPPSIYSQQQYSSSLQSLSLSNTRTTIYDNNTNHAFQPASFIRPTKCHACGDKIWGRSEYKCEDCHYVCHSKCLQKVPQHCTSNQGDCSSIFSMESNTTLLSNRTKKTSVSSTESIFGQDLCQRVSIERSKTPCIVKECIQAVENRGIDYEGIYRKSGGAAQIKIIKLAFDHHEKIDLNDPLEINDICSVTSALKQYFCNLPNPLLTFELYDSFISLSSMDNDEKKLNGFKETMEKLPKAHLDTVILLFNHLAKISRHSDQNLMTVKNLAMVFAPTLMRHCDPSRDFLDISYKNAVMEYIILHAQEILSQ